MRYAMKELFDYMDLGKPVRVTSTDGKVFTGRCWAYGDVQNEEEFGRAEASLEVGPGAVLYASEIERIEVLEESQ